MWRSVVISKPARLRRHHFSLAIEQEETIHVPFEDIAVIVLHHREILLTHPVLSACAEYGISLFAMDDSYMPSGVFLSYLQHSRATRLLRLQMQLKRPLTKQLWAALIRQKIVNQASCLQLAGKSADRLQALIDGLRSGDPDNAEAQASKIYFPTAFGRGFYRQIPILTNAALNYGYAVLRGTLARGLVAHGFLPSLGLFHDNEQNAFNLADDLIEPYRPLIDLHVISRIHFCREQTDELNTADKAAIVALLHVDVGMPKGEMTVLSAIEYTVESLVRCYQGENASLLELPQLIGLSTHTMRDW